MWEAKSGAMLTLISLVHAYERSPPYKKTLLIGFIDFRYFGLLGTGRREGSYKAPSPVVKP